MVAVLVSGIFLLIFVHGVLNRPILKYSMECPEFFNPVFEDYIVVYLESENTGNIDSNVILRLQTINATISDYGIERPHEVISNNMVEFYYLLSKNDHSRDKIIIYPDISNDSFSLDYTLIKNKKFNTYSNIINSLFGEITPLYPTHLTFTNIEGVYRIE